MWFKLLALTLQEINKMIAEVDKDGSGAIDFDEFCHMMTAKFGERDTKEELMKAFYIIDQDKNVSYCQGLHTIIASSHNWFFVMIAGEDFCCRHSAHGEGVG